MDAIAFGLGFAVRFNMGVFGKSNVSFASDSEPP
jgi:hypothetical protein